MGNVVHVNFGDEEVSLNKHEIAKRLGYSVRWVEELTRQEILPSTIRGRRRLYKETECRNAIAQHERGAAHATAAVAEVRG